MKTFCRNVSFYLIQIYFYLIFCDVQVTRTTIEYLFGILSRLQPLSEDTEVEVMQRILSTMTHQHMCAEYSINCSIASNISRRTINTGEMSNNMVRSVMLKAPWKIKIGLDKQNSEEI